jgi:hypothetical protein
LVSRSLLWGLGSILDGWRQVMYWFLRTAGSFLLLAVVARLTVNLHPALASLIVFAVVIGALWMMGKK